uniref:Uncharacterized protein n=1 Tax=Coccidioides posadasii RMSCC 3488 TaxID=454284 RepID=A0A0J6F4J3_COCPO|nr:hypothetical protein CPAG_04169 [Coccidioides posadasii RMSCC 3488]
MLNPTPERPEPVIQQNRSRLWARNRDFRMLGLHRPEAQDCQNASARSTRVRLRPAVGSLDTFMRSVDLDTFAKDSRFDKSSGTPMIKPYRGHTKIDTPVVLVKDVG